MVAADPKIVGRCDIIVLPKVPPRKEDIPSKILSNNPEALSLTKSSKEDFFSPSSSGLLIPKISLNLSKKFPPTNIPKNLFFNSEAFLLALIAALVAASARLAIHSPLVFFLYCIGLPSSSRTVFVLPSPLPVLSPVACPPSWIGAEESPVTFLVGSLALLLRIISLTFPTSIPSFNAIRQSLTPVL